ncbi:AAA domain-containing protein [Tahibacter aquaticus]|uniref:AAA domain-containing protein n=1 Tax=Tahibacter aquaticus TaxID=520092 RepID=A0A4R6YLU7_9GAMM|nr:AAA family ATPase [Tahibacter aquaticus]TDR38239.1 AAA domain-containing protein [Tahibacter aquaticus]
MFEFRALEVVHWDYWQRFTLPLDAAIVTVVGPNGSGKTTLLDALRTLLAIEDRETARDYKTYLRHNGKPLAWLRGVVSNRPDRNGRRPFFPLMDAEVTLACRIRKKGGDWTRDYQIVGGDSSIEAIEAQGGEWLGLRDYRVRLEGAGLTRAIRRVLTLEQGATDKLCQYPPRELLQLVWDVFGEKPVLEDYQRARAEQFATEQELKVLGQDLAALHTRLEAAKSDVRSFEEYGEIVRERHRLEVEVAPKVSLAERKASLDGSRPRLTGLRRSLRDCRERERALETAEAAAVAKLQRCEQELQQAQARALRAEGEFLVARDAARDVEQLTKRREQLERVAASQGSADVPALLREVEQDRRRQAELKLGNERARERKAELDAQIAALASGQRYAPGFEREFRSALDVAGIAHRMLADVVEVTDPAWEAAVEAVLNPYRHLVLLASPGDAKAAFALGEQCQYRHFVVAERAPVEQASAGSLLEVLRFSADPPAWLPRQLDKLRRVADVAAGSRLPAGQDWITPKGYLREHRGGRHIGTEERNFGASARQSQLQELQREHAALLQAQDTRSQESSALVLRLDSNQARLLKLDAAQELVTRASEFAAADEALAALQQSAQDSAAALSAARDAVDAARQAHKQEEMAAGDRRAQRGNLQREHQEKEQQLAQERNTQVRRILEYRHQRHLLPAAWRKPEALAAAHAEFETHHEVQRELERLSHRIERGGFVTDDTCVAMRDKIGADHETLESTLSRRDAHLARAKRITDEARGAYINVLRATVRQYAKNLRALGELSGINVEVDQPELANDDIALAQAGLSVRFDFDRKGWIGLDDGEASGGQQVMKSLLLLVALLRDETHPGGFVFIDEPFAHLDVFNIEKVGSFLRATEAQYILTTPITHNLNVFNPSDLVLTTTKRRPNSAWAEPVAVLKRARPEAAAKVAGA